MSINRSFAEFGIVPKGGSNSSWTVSGRVAFIEKFGSLSRFGIAAVRTLQIDYRLRAVTLNSELPLNIVLTSYDEQGTLHVITLTSNVIHI